MGYMGCDVLKVKKCEERMSGSGDNDQIKMMTKSKIMQNRPGVSLVFVARSTNLSKKYVTLQACWRGYPPTPGILINANLTN